MSKLKKFEYGGKEGKEAAAFAVKELTKNKDFVDRRYAIAALQTLGPEIAPYIDAYVKALSDEDGGVRYHTAMAWGGVGKAAAPHAATLAAALKDKDPGVRYWCLVALGKLGEEAADHGDAVFESLGDADVSVRVAAAETIKAVRPSDVPRVVERFTSSLLDRDEELIFRIASAEGLLAIGDAAGAGAEAPQCKALGHSLKDRYAGVREVAAKALADLGPTAVLPYSTELAALAAGDANEDVRAAASAALQRLEPAASLQADDLALRLWAASTIASQGGAAVEPHAEVFAEMLQGSENDLRYHAAVAFSGCCAAALKHTDGLKSALLDADGRVRVAAMKALADSSPDLVPDAVEVLVESLGTSKDAAHRASSAEALFFAGLAVKPHTEALAKALKDEEFPVRLAAVRALQQGGRTCVRGTGTELARLAKKDPDIDVRRAADKALREYNLAVKFGLEKE